jgi:phosphoribosylglycinamide formyltransferase 1
VKYGKLNSKNSFKTCSKDMKKKKTRIVIITSNAIRHNYFKLMFALSGKIDVLKTYVEHTGDMSLKIKHPTSEIMEDLISYHFDTRHNTEYDFFSDIVRYMPDHSNSKTIKKGDINKDEIINEIEALNPDLIVTYGCSIIKPKLIDKFQNRIINVHLGLSPYYMGSGTNFHCLVNNEFYFEGYTFMYMDYGIDTGVIIHQERAVILPFDNPHQIGNRLIKSMTKKFMRLVENFQLVQKTHPIDFIGGKTYKNADATLELTDKLYNNFNSGGVIKYLKEKEFFFAKFPILQQGFLIDD